MSKIFKEGKKITTCCKPALDFLRSSSIPEYRELGEATLRPGGQWWNHFANVSALPDYAATFYIKNMLRYFTRKAFTNK